MIFLKTLPFWELILKEAVFSEKAFDSKVRYLNQMYKDCTKHCLLRPAVLEILHYIFLKNQKSKISFCLLLTFVLFGWVQKKNTVVILIEIEEGFAPTIFVSRTMYELIAIWDLKFLAFWSTTFL